MCEKQIIAQHLIGDLANIACKYIYGSVTTYTGRLSWIQRVVSEMRFNQKHGKSVTYHSDDINVKYVEHYLFDKRHGIATTYYRNGRKKCVQFMKHGRLHGTSTTYYDNARNTIEHVARYVDGLLQGEVITYCRYRGKITMKYQYVDGELHGKASSYWINGNTKYTDTWVRGKRTGEVTRCYENGKREYVYEYLNGTVYDYHGCRHGLCIRYRTNGNVSSRRMYHQGLLHGKTINYYPNGLPHRTIMYVDGIKHGPAINYNRNGVIVNDKAYVNGSR